MSKLFKNATKKKTTILVNDNITMFANWDTKTLVDLDNENLLHNVTIGTGKYMVNGETKEISTLIVELADKRVAVPFSRNFDPSLLEGDEITSCMFRITRKQLDSDKEGEYTGAQYMSFGKPSGITFEEEKSLINAEPVDAQA